MLASALLALREGIEAALIIGIIIGALHKSDRLELKPAVWIGTAVAVLFSLLTAIVLARIGIALEGDAEKIFEGVTMLLAAGVLTWMIFWMKRQARGMKRSIESDVLAASSKTTFFSLFLLVFFTIIREGVELALFLTAASFATGQEQVIIGALIGLGVAILLGWLLYTSSVRLNLGLFFNVTSFFLLIFAAGLVAHGVHEFNELGWIPAVIDPIWNINHILDESSPVGAVLNALFGYNGNPSLTEALAYVGYLATIMIALRLATLPQPRQRHAKA